MKKILDKSCRIHMVKHWKVLLQVIIIIIIIIIIVVIIVKALQL